MSVKIIIRVVFGLLCLSVLSQAESNTLLGHWEVDRVEAQKSIESYTNDEDIAFLLYMILDSMEEIEFDADGSCTMVMNHQNPSRKKCWVKNAHGYTLYSYSGNRAGTIDVLDTNNVEIGLSDDAFPEVLALHFDRVGE